MPRYITEKVVCMGTVKWWAWVIMPVALLLSVVLLGVLVGIVPSYRLGSLEVSEEADPGELSFVGAMEVERHLEDDPRGPALKLLTTKQGVLAVFEEDVALFGTDPVEEIWNYSNLGGQPAAGVTADGEQVVLAFEGTGLFSHQARWLLLESSSGETIAAHWSDFPPDVLVEALGASARLMYSGDGQVEARSLDRDQELWQRELGVACENVHIVAVGSIFTLAMSCDGEVRLVGMAADTGELQYEYSWTGEDLPELLPLTNWTIPGAEEDPLDRVIRGNGDEQYLLMTGSGVDTSFSALEYFPQPSGDEQIPDFVVLIEDPVEAEYRMILASGHLFLERGLVDPETLEEEGLLIEGELPKFGQEWGAGLVAKSEALHRILSGVVDENDLIL
jgi:hypothetical protein